MTTETKQPEAWVEQDVAAMVPTTAAQPLIDLRDKPSPDILRVLAIGSPQVVHSCVLTLYRLGYAEPKEWSRALPTPNPGEVMRILTKRVMLAAE
ncbi:MAG: hypothetical protein AAFX01_07000 [Cyanobacteria bacterium J06638_28]